MCDGVFSDSIIANSLLILTVISFENRLILDNVKVNKKFLCHPVGIKPSIPEYSEKNRTRKVTQFIILYSIFCEFFLGKTVVVLAAWVFSAMSVISVKTACQFTAV